MSYKPFCKNLYEQFNQMGIETAIHFLAQHGYNVTDRTEVYKDWDFRVEKDGKSYGVEVEVTNKWEYKLFPYPYMSVPHRKKDSKADFYVRVNKHGNALIWIPMTQVLSAPVITKNTCYTSGEKFFNLKSSSLPLYYQEEGHWKLSGSSPLSPFSEDELDVDNYTLQGV
jgi:hypothetical protein